MRLFFRKFSLENIKANGFYTYLKYALGEITLITIGILLAFSLNKWNETRKNHLLTQEYIQEIKADLKNDKSVFSIEVKNIGEILEFKKWGLNTVEFTDSELDSIELFYSSYYHNLKINNAAYKRFQAANISTNNEYSEIIRKIKNYYSFSAEYLDNFNKWEFDLANKEHQYIFYQSSFEIDINLILKDSISTLQNNKLDRSRRLKFIQSIQARNILKYGIIRESIMQNIYQSMMKEADKIIAEIDKIQ